MTFCVLGASTVVRLGRPDELLEVGSYGLRDSRAEAEELAEHVPHAVIVPADQVRTFGAKELWRVGRGAAA